MSTAGTLYSAHWYRVGSLHPRIQPGTQVRRQVLRDEEWFVFTHPLSGKHYRLNRKAYELVARFDGEVRAAGIAFFVLMPAPYVNASAATTFGSKWQRIAVSSAGIIAELFLSALAYAVWSSVENGIVRDAAFVVMAIGGLSTLVFNANPLLRFDGYYILCDLLEMPNLASRSQQWWSDALARYFRRGGDDSMAANRVESAWLFLYTPASWAYRLFISVVIVEWIVSKSTLLGFVATLWLLYTLLAKPIAGILRHAIAPSHPGAHGWKPTMVAGGVTLVLVAGLFVIPVPASTMAEGVVWLPERSQVRTASDGSVVKILAKDGERVKAGEPLVEIEEPPLLAKRDQLLAQLTAAQTENVDGWQQASVKGRNAAEDIDRLQRDLEEANEEIDKLTLRAGVDGVFVFPHANDTLGRHVPKGTLLGYVLANDPTIVRVAIAQDDIGLFKGGVKDVSVELSEEGNQHFPAQVLRVDPAATTHLPANAFGDKGGGDIVTDPTDHDGMTALEPFYVADVQLNDRNVVRAGAHAWVRFEHTARPLARTGLLRFRQLFLRVFSGEAA